MHQLQRVKFKTIQYFFAVDFCSSLDVIEVIEILERPVRQICLDRSNPFEVYTNDKLKQRFRFHKHTAHLPPLLIITYSSSFSWR